MANPYVIFNYYRRGFDPLVNHRSINIRKFMVCISYSYTRSDHNILSNTDFFVAPHYYKFTYKASFTNYYFPTTLKN